MEQPDSIELKVICCKDLKAFNFFQKLNIYVVVSIVNEEEDDDNNSTPSPSPSPSPSPTPSPTKEKKKKQQQQQQKQKTPIDREGDGNPEWNHLMQFDLKDIFSSSSSSLLLQFDLLSEGTILGDKTIGRVRVPLKDLINGGAVVRFVSYQVRTTDGIPNGVLDFSFKPIFIHNPNANTNHHTSFVEDNPNKFKFGNESAPPLPIGGNVDDVPLIYPPMMMPSTINTNYYPPPPLETHHHNPSPAESYYPKIDHFHNPSQEIHYPTLEIHSPPSQQFHNPSHPEQVYYPQPQPQPHLLHNGGGVDYHHQLPPSPPCYHHHHHPHPPQMAYYPPPPPPLYYPSGPPTTNPYGGGGGGGGGGHEFGRVVGNPNRPVAYDGYPNYWVSTTQPIHW